MERLYLYLGRRDKKGIKILSVLKGYPCAPGRLADLKRLALPPAMEQQIQQQIYADRMLWEPWIESATDFAALKQSLTNRGFTALPLASSPIFSMEKDMVVSDRGQLQYKPVAEPIVADTKTMLRKIKS